MGANETSTYSVGKSTADILHDGQSPSYGTQQIPHTSPSSLGSLLPVVYVASLSDCVPVLDVDSHQGATACDEWIKCIEARGNDVVSRCAIRSAGDHLRVCCCLLPDAVCRDRKHSSATRIDHTMIPCGDSTDHCMQAAHTASANMLLRMVPRIRVHHHPSRFTLPIVLIALISRRYLSNSPSCPPFFPHRTYRLALISYHEFFAFRSLVHLCGPFHLLRF